MVRLLLLEAVVGRPRKLRLRGEAGRASAVRPAERVRPYSVRRRVVDVVVMRVRAVRRVARDRRRHGRPVARRRLAPHRSPRRCVLLRRDHRRDGRAAPASLELVLLLLVVPVELAQPLGVVLVLDEDLALVVGGVLGDLLEDLLVLRAHRLLGHGDVAFLALQVEERLLQFRGGLLLLRDRVLARVLELVHAVLVDRLRARAHDGVLAVRALLPLARLGLDVDVLVVVDAKVLGEVLVDHVDRVLRRRRRPPVRRLGVLGRARLGVGRRAHVRRGGDSSGSAQLLLLWVHRRRRRRRPGRRTTRRRRRARRRGSTDNK
mmetsp:Transcript_8535/g.35151  ORF Transcript_8535/g.35151 Transcript_8535/m.35151 type:complete len:319 (-) Transcript_8535:644-1600(-)